MDTRKQVRIITDGACLGNPGPGGWAAILRHGVHTRELYGPARHTTNNRMELAAAIEGLRALRERCEVEITTDSEYLKNGITTWIHNWKRKGWLTSEKKPVMNRDLWMVLDELASKHRVQWLWTKGHAADADNNRADELASRAAHEQVASRGWKPDPALPSYELNRDAAAPPLLRPAAPAVEKVNLAETFARISEHWDPQVLGNVNDVQVKVVKLLGDFVWHQHAAEDEMFYVVSGSLLMRFRDREVRVDPGEFLIVPRGVEHKPFAELECQVLLIEPKSTVRTGDAK